MRGPATTAAGPRMHEVVADSVVAFVGAEC